MQNKGLSERYLEFSQLTDAIVDMEEVAKRMLVAAEITKAKCIKFKAQLRKLEQTKEGVLTE